MKARKAQSQRKLVAQLQEDPDFRQLFEEGVAEYRRKYCQLFLTT